MWKLEKWNVFQRINGVVVTWVVANADVKRQNLDRPAGGSIPS